MLADRFQGREAAQGIRICAELVVGPAAELICTIWLNLQTITSQYDSKSKRRDLYADYLSFQFKVFHLYSREMSYVIGIVHGYPAHVYWGGRLRDEADFSGMVMTTERCSFSPNPVEDDYTISLDTLPQEYPQYGTSDYREPAYQVQLEDGTRISELRYASHRIASGKPALKGLPAVYTECDSEADTLELILRDDYSGMTVILSYTVFAEANALTRSVRFELDAEARPLRLQSALSASIDFNDRDYELLYLSGAWTRERHIVRRAVAPGSTRLESRRGSSSHNLNPFAALLPAQYRRGAWRGLWVQPRVQRQLPGGG